MVYFSLESAQIVASPQMMSGLITTLIYPGISVNALDITLVLLLVVVNKIFRLANR